MQPNPLNGVSSDRLSPPLQYENDYDLGVAVIDSYTHYMLEFMEGINKTSQATMEDLVRILIRVVATFLC